MCPAEKRQFRRVSLTVRKNIYVTTRRSVRCSPGIWSRRNFLVNSPPGEIPHWIDRHRRDYTLD